MEYRTDLTEILHCIDPASLNYQDWINVGMGLKEAGYAASDWARWSANGRAFAGPRTRSPAGRLCRWLWSAAGVLLMRSALWIGTI